MLGVSNTPITNYIYYLPNWDNVSNTVLAVLNTRELALIARWAIIIFDNSRAKSTFDDSRPFVTILPVPIWPAIVNVILPESGPADHKLSAFDTRPSSFVTDAIWRTKPSFDATSGLTVTGDVVSFEVPRM